MVGSVAVYGHIRMSLRAMVIVINGRVRRPDPYIEAVAGRLSHCWPTVRPTVGPFCLGQYGGRKGCKDRVGMKWD